MFQRRIAVIDGGRHGACIVTQLRMMGLDAVEAATFDWAEQGTWPAALRGATAICIAGAVPRGADAGMLGIVAADMGVEHVVLLSPRGGRGMLAAERTLRRAPLDHTIIRIAQPTGDAEIAAAAVAALCDPRLLNRTYDLPVPPRPGSTGRPLRAPSASAPHPEGDRTHAKDHRLDIHER